MERQHRKYSPSQAERLFGCEGSMNLLERVPARAESEYAKEGNEAHDVLEAALRNRCATAKEGHEDHSYLFAEDLNTTENQFYWSIQVCMNYVYDILNENPDAVMFLETFVDPPSVVAPGQTGGYCDIAIYIPSKRQLYIIDYKHGVGVAKDVEGNPQPKQYGAGFLFEKDAKIDQATVDLVTLVIVQPRAFHEDGITRECDVTPWELMEYLDELEVQIAKSQKPDAPLNPDKKSKGWCMFCDAKTQCPAREEMALRAVGDSFKQIEQVTAPQLPNVRGLDIDRLARVRLYGPMLRKFLDDVDDYCYELAMAGHEVANAKLVKAQARRKWYGDEEKVARELSALTGKPVDDLMDRKLIGITMAEKLVVEAYKKNVSRDRKKQAAEDGKKAMAFLTIKDTSGNLTLANDDDPRPSVNRAQTTFSQLAIAPPTLEQ